MNPGAQEHRPPHPALMWARASELLVEINYAVSKQCDINNLIRNINELARQVKRLEHVTERTHPLRGKACSICYTTVTPQWREGPRGKNTLCNACGLNYRRQKEEEHRRAKLLQSRLAKLTYIKKCRIMMQQEIRKTPKKSDIYKLLN
jgi:hypothetical protein